MTSEWIIRLGSCQPGLLVCYCVMVHDCKRCPCAEMQVQGCGQTTAARYGKGKRGFWGHSQAMHDLRDDMLIRVLIRLRHRKALSQMHNLCIPRPCR